MKQEENEYEVKGEIKHRIFGNKKWQSLACDVNEQRSNEREKE